VRFDVGWVLQDPEEDVDLVWFNSAEHFWRSESVSEGIHALQHEVCPVNVVFRQMEDPVARVFREFVCLKHGSLIAEN